MKRSLINQSIELAMQLAQSCHFKLPPFAYWNVPQWKENKEKLGNLKEIMLGWDVSDFGMGNFEKYGAVLFTMRNGSVHDSSLGTPYAEKLIVLQHETEQQIPLHYHRLKTEDIINRGSGILVLELFNCAKDGSPDRESKIHVKMDGIIHTLPAGAIIEIEPGASITLTPRLYHRFWGKKGCGDLLAGEVSSVNDDTTDNVFWNVPKRFSDVIEDAPVLYPLCNEYDRILAD